ncbi:MAG: helix-turn-helix domain-containing protein [Huintestinicola sp.]
MDYSVFSMLCTKNGTTPTALALKLGLSKGNTSSWKKGGNPSVDILIKLADELNCTTDLLLDREKKSSAYLTGDELNLLNIS